MIERCPNGHFIARYSQDQQVLCMGCLAVVDVATPETDPETLLAAAEAKECDPGWRHMLADQALLEMLRPSAPDFVARYEALEERFLFS